MRHSVEGGCPRALLCTTDPVGSATSEDSGNLVSFSL